MAEIYTRYMPGESEQMFGSAVSAAANKLNAPINNPSAYGSVPAPVPAPLPTARANTGEAITAGQQAAAQLPGYGTSLGNIGAAIKSETAGKLPEDVLQQLQQTAAERGVAMGAPGSPNVNADLLAAIGTNSLDLIQRGIGNFEGVVPNLPGYGISQNPGFYTTPQETYDAAVQNSVWASSPNPAAAAAANLAAARQGAGAGAGSVRPGTISAPTLPTIPLVNPMNNQSGAAQGMYYGGVWYPTGSLPPGAQPPNVNPNIPGASGSAGGSQDPWSQIIAQYADTVSGGQNNAANSGPLSEGDMAPEYDFSVQ